MAWDEEKGKLRPKLEKLSQGDIQWHGLGGGGGPISEEFSDKGPGIKRAAGTRMASFLALFGSVFEGWATDTRGIRC